MICGVACKGGIPEMQVRDFARTEDVTKSLGVMTRRPG